jgi:hypothetical protein
LLQTTSTGNVGIGTTSPQRKLEVNGSIRMGALITGAGTAVAVYRDVNGDLADSTSSIRYKTDVTTMENVLPKLMDLSAVRFNWGLNTSTPGMSDFGMVAEQVNTILPDLVTYEADGITPHGLKYEKMGLFAIKGLQEQQLEIANLANSINLTNSTNLTDVILQTLEAQGAVTFKADVTFQGPAIFKAIAEYFDTVIFHKDINVLGTATFNSDTAGLAVIPAKANEVNVVFDKEYAASPIVTASPLWDTDQGTLDVMNQLGTYILPKQDYIIANVTTKGFTIILEQPAVTDLKFSWTATSVANAKTTVGNVPIPTATPTVTPSASPSASPNDSSGVSATPSASPTASPSASPVATP